ncbi:MAG: hypothetical protein SF097_13570 [Acidobacteriota bacterium]|nr:hypothetical protein [Acidobacteriota bacterium]
MKKTLNTRTFFTAGRSMLLVKLVIGCLVLAVTLAISATQAKEFPNTMPAVSTEFSATDDPTDELTERPSELGGDDDELPIAERPGKPDSHNSNGDDVLVRPVR